MLIGRGNYGLEAFAHFSQSGEFFSTCKGCSYDLDISPLLGAWFTEMVSRSLCIFPFFLIFFKAWRCLFWWSSHGLLFTDCYTHLCCHDCETIAQTKVKQVYSFYFFEDIHHSFLLGHWSPFGYFLFMVGGRDSTDGFTWDFRLSQPYVLETIVLP